jgi:hypothetical protein
MKAINKIKLNNLSESVENTYYNAITSKSNRMYKAIDIMNLYQDDLLKTSMKEYKECLEHLKEDKKNYLFFRTIDNNIINNNLKYLNYYNKGVIKLSINYNLLNHTCFILGGLNNGLNTINYILLNQKDYKEYKNLIKFNKNKWYNTKKEVPKDLLKIIRNKDKSNDKIIKVLDNGIKKLSNDINNIKSKEMDINYTNETLYKDNYNLYKVLDIKEEALNILKNKKISLECETANTNKDIKDLTLLLNRVKECQIVPNYDSYNKSLLQLKKVLLANPNNTNNINKIKIFIK